MRQPVPTQSRQPFAHVHKADARPLYDSASISCTYSRGLKLAQSNSAWTNGTANAATQVLGHASAGENVFAFDCDLSAYPVGTTFGAIIATLTLQAVTIAGTLVLNDCQSSPSQTDPNNINSVGDSITAAVSTHPVSAMVAVSTGTEIVLNVPLGGHALKRGAWRCGTSVPFTVGVFFENFPAFANAAVIYGQGSAKRPTLTLYPVAPVIYGQKITASTVTGANHNEDGTYSFTPDFDPIAGYHFPALSSHYAVGRPRFSWPMTDVIAGRSIASIVHRFVTDASSGAAVATMFYVQRPVDLALAQQAFDDVAAGTALYSFALSSTGADTSEQGFPLRETSLPAAAISVVEALAGGTTPFTAGLMIDLETVPNMGTPMDNYALFRTDTVHELIVTYA
jgi:hypothetical protein